jgi:hypothetical protein
MSHGLLAPPAHPSTPQEDEDSPYITLKEAAGPMLTKDSGERFYSRVRLIKLEEIHGSNTRSQVAGSRRGPRSSRNDTASPTSPSRDILHENSASTVKRRVENSQNKRKLKRSNKSNDYRVQSVSSRRTRSKSKHGNDDKYDAYPWSAYYRDQVMILNKIPKPPYFLQLPSGLRPDTIVLRNIPVSWFLDTAEEVKEERERELNETKVVKFPGNMGGGDNAKKEPQGPESDSPFWFTQHGHIIIKAACMRFGPVRRVDLVFEMESRDEEWSLCFDAYIQFKYFSGFRDAYIAFDGGILLHISPSPPPSSTSNTKESNIKNQQESMYLIPEFDITGHFSDHQVQLRKVRKEMEETKRDKEEYLRKRQHLKLKRRYKDELFKLKKALKKMMNDMEDVEIYLKRLLKMMNIAEEAESKSSENEMDIFNEERRENNGHNTHEAKYNEGKDVGKEEGDNEEGGKEEGKREEKVQNIFIEATKEARKNMILATNYIENLPDTGESTINIETGEITGALNTLQLGRKHLANLNKSIKYANQIIFQEHTMLTVKVPSLLDTLEDDGNVHIMLNIIKNKIKTNGEEYFYGKTIFIPSDRGFSVDTIFTESCWSTHIINGPYHMRDLYDLSNNGTGDILLSGSNDDGSMNQISTSLNEVGEFIVSVNKVGHPKKICRIERQDIDIENGSVLHFIDRVLFPPSY